MSNLFQKVEQEAFRRGIQPRTQESRNWFRRKVQNMRVNRYQLMREPEIERVQPGRMRNRAMIGSMAMFFYDAKNRDTLPFWDAFPLVIIAGPAPKGFYGINLHYLPIPLRAKFLDRLMDYTTDKAFDEDTKFQARYRFLKKTPKLRYFEPCFKHYLTEQLDSKIAMVNAPEWEIATFMPTAQWRGTSRRNVYRETRKQLNA